MLPSVSSVPRRRNQGTQCYAARGRCSRHRLQTIAESFMRAVRCTARFRLSFEFLSDPWLCAHQQAMKKVDPATVQRRSSAVANLFTPKVTSMLWPCACSARTVNVSWLWCEQAAGTAVAAAIGAQSMHWRSSHVVMASPGAESVGHGRPQRSPAMAAIAYRRPICLFWGRGGSLRTASPASGAPPTRIRHVYCTHTDGPEPPTRVYMPITHRERASVMHSDLTHTVNVGGTEV